jgi:hypothetical protein
VGARGPGSILGGGFYRYWLHEKFG